MNYINASFRSDDPRGRAISNLSPHSFILDDVHCKTVESFIQGIKFPPNDPRRDRVIQMDGVAAWKMRIHAQGDYVWWDGEQIVYRSPEHSALIRRAIEAKFSQNPDAMEALISTRGLTITHITGQEPESPTTTLPAKIYCAILTEIREQAQ